MLAKPMKRIWPSVMANMRANTCRQSCGSRKGSSPSMTSIRLKASNRVCDKALAPYLRAAGAGAAALPEPRMDLKKSLLGSTTITSDLLRKLLR